MTADVTTVYAVANSTRLGNPETAWGRCVIESSGLARMLANAYPGHAIGMIGVNGLNYPGREHWAVVLDMDSEHPQVVDLTARQFDADAAYPWQGDLFEWLDDCTEWLADHLSALAYRFNPDSPMGVGDDWEWQETHVREDVEPGDPGPYPWQSEFHR